MNLNSCSIIFLISLTFCVFNAHFVNGKEQWERNALAMGATGNSMNMLRNVRNEVKEKGCSLNLCFVLDGTSAITPAEFQFQKNFVDLVVAITTTDRAGTFCAYQYGNKVTKISSLAKNRVAFLNRVRSARKMYGKPYLEPALRQAVNQVFLRTFDANKVLIFSKNKPLQQRKLQNLVDNFFKRRGGLCSVSIQPKNVPNLRKLLRSRNLVFPKNGFFEVSEVITDVVHMVCGME